MRADPSACARKIDETFQEAPPLTCRFALMLRCDDPACRRLNIISSGQDIRLLQSSRFFCWMNPEVDPSQSHCPHMTEAGETRFPDVSASTLSMRKRKATSSLPQANELHRNKTARGSFTKTNTCRKKISGSVTHDKDDSKSSTRNFDFDQVRIPDVENRGIAPPPSPPTSPKRSGRSKQLGEHPTIGSTLFTTPPSPPHANRNAPKQDIPREVLCPSDVGGNEGKNKIHPYPIGSVIMVLYGKTIYPGKVLDRDDQTLHYLVQYDGSSASRNEWRGHDELMSIDEVLFIFPRVVCVGNAR
eukprot:m.294213 g.294213  ORF g.294213 m.294213 type:complete len:301 (+) comp20027_c0_seq1:289-1191(+)